jgi:hypothetical protein
MLQPPKPRRPCLDENGTEILPPFIIEIEVNCDECGGSGYDPGGIDPWGPDLCPACHGAKTQKITRNYLAEAFQIAANPESTRPVERQHLVAIVQYCREAVSAVVGLPELPEHARTRPALKRSVRRSRSRSQSHTVTQIARRKTNVDISPQRARSRKRATAD